MPATEDARQDKTVDCDAGEATFVRFRFESGLGAFAAVHSLIVM